MILDIQIPKRLGNCHGEREDHQVKSIHHFEKQENLPFFWFSKKKKIKNELV